MDRGAAGYDEYYGYGIVNAYEAIATAAIYVEATPTFGTPPMTVDFAGTTGRPAISWEWSFGDGEFAFVQNPTHEYTDPGYYTVGITINTADNSFTRTYEGLISIEADTLDISETQLDEFDTARVDIWVRNYVPIKEITIPFTYEGPFDLTYAYATADGLRTSYFDNVSTTSNVPQWSVGTIYLDAGLQEYLPPGEGPVATLVFAFNGGGTGSNPVGITSYLGRELSFVTYEGIYVPTAFDGSIDIDCCVGTVGDVNGDGLPNPTIGDISALIDHLFITQDPLGCYPEADVNQSGGTNPTEADITIGDISSLIDHLFISGTEPPPCL
jgi:PKD repeat protein